MKAGEGQKECVELVIVFGFGQGGFLRAESLDLEFHGIAPGAHFGSERLLLGAGNEEPLMGGRAIDGSAVFRGMSGAGSLEPVGGNAQAVAVVVEEGVFGGEAALGFVKILDAGDAERKASRSEVWPSLSRSAAGLPMAAAMYMPKWA